MNHLIKNKSLIWCVSIPVISGYLLYKYLKISKEHLDDYENNSLSTNISELSDYSSDDEYRGDEDEFKRGKIDLYCHLFNTTYKLEQGFKNVKKLDEYEIGLFDMGYENNHSMWMKDTITPLDMIFLNRDYTIVGMIKNTEPLSEKSLFINKISYYVIETNAGFCDKYSLETDMNIKDIFNLLIIH